MRSIRSLATSGVVAWAERRLFSAGGAADAHSSLAFAVKPASAAQDIEPDAPPPSDPVTIMADGTGAVAATQTAQATSPDLDAANETTPPAPTAYSVATISQAARAYAQVLQALSETKASRGVSANRATQHNTDAER